MLRILLLPILFGYALVGFSQDSQTIDSSTNSITEVPADTEIITNSTSENEAEKPQDDNESENSFDLDSQVYDEAEDIFVPSEEIPADEPIQFPTNI